MGKLLKASQETKAMSHIKIIENEYVRKNRKKTNYYERKKIQGRERQIFRVEYRTTWSETVKI